jgi:hypothetical protein
MSQYACYRVKFSIQNSAGRTVAGPYTTFIGISGGSRGDQPTGVIAASLATAITNNRNNIVAALGAGTVAPGGTVSIDAFEHAEAPDLWV